MTSKGVCRRGRVLKSYRLLGLAYRKGRATPDVSSLDTGGRRRRRRRRRRGEERRG
jgi:hypothetical protein